MTFLLLREKFVDNIILPSLEPVFTFLAKYNISPTTILGIAILVILVPTLKKNLKRKKYDMNFFIDLGILVVIVVCTIILQFVFMNQKKS